MARRSMRANDEIGIAVASQNGGAQNGGVWRERDRPEFVVPYAARFDGQALNLADPTDVLRRDAISPDHATAST